MFTWHRLAALAHVRGKFPLEVVVLPPPHIRSESFPMGLPDLASRLPKDAARVLTANMLYDLVAKIVEFCTKSDVAWTIGNPANSLFWFLPQVQNLLINPAVADAIFQHCMFVGPRDTKTMVRHFPGGVFSGLHRLCDNKHVHAPWGKTPYGSSATALETVYPQGLCDAIADLLQKFLGFTSVAPLDVAVERGATTRKHIGDDRAAAGVQPRGTKSRRLLPELRQVLKIRLQGVWTMLASNLITSGTHV